MQQRLCPLSWELIEDPVLAPDGITYERSYLKKHLTSGLPNATRSPSTNQAFQHLASFNVDTAPQNFLYKQLIETHFPILSEIRTLSQDIVKMQTSSATIAHPSMIAVDLPVTRSTPGEIPASIIPPARALSTQASWSSTWHGRPNPPSATPTVSVTNAVGVIKIELIGDENAGATQVLHRYLKPQLLREQLRLSVDFGLRCIIINDTSVTLQIWDKTGQKRYRTSASSHYCNAHALLLMYSTENRQSFTHVSYWLYSSFAIVRQNTSPVIHLVATHGDSQNRVVSEEDGRALANQYSIGYSECDAMNHRNIEEAFETVAHQALQNHQAGTAPASNRR